jgi:hypothetical protein
VQILQTALRLTVGTLLSDPGPPPPWLPLAFLALWLSLCAIFAVTSGWVSLALRFRAHSQPEGPRIIGQITQIGIIRETRATHMILSEAGLYLYSNILFRIFHPPLLIPWPEVRLIREVKTLWGSTYKLDLASVTSLRVTRAAYEALKGYLDPNLDLEP